MNHKQKQRLARKLQTSEEAREKGKGIFESAGWEKRKDLIEKRIQKREARQKEMARKRKERKMKILDDKGKEHKVGEIFESNTLTIEI